MRVKLLVVLAIVSTVFMFLTGTASAGTVADCGGCGTCDQCLGGTGFGFIDPSSLVSNVEGCLTSCPTSDVTGLEGVSSDLVSASGFALPTFAGSEVGNEILGVLVEDDFSTPDLVSAGFIPSFVPVDTAAELECCVVPSCVDFSSHPFLFDPNVMGGVCSNKLCGDDKCDKCDKKSCDGSCVCDKCGKKSCDGSCDKTVDDSVCNVC